MLSAACFGLPAGMLIQTGITAIFGLTGQAKSATPDRES